MLGVMTGNLDYMQPPTSMNGELKELAENPAFERMLKYAFIGSKKSVKEKTLQFLKETGVNEVMVASHIYHHEDRIKSYRIFAELMKELS
jgi:alkanesulfonate monooxygenase SsuD/methylene tetrahydromethanopterin reductase-like flavin-dependent oxidoreductase (luciferase family)